MYDAILKGSDPDPTKRECFDCIHCKGAISWWCKNKDAVKAHGTSIPGFKNCEFWEPVRKYEDLNWFEKFISRDIIIER